MTNKTVTMPLELVRAVANEMCRLGYGYHESHALSILHSVQSTSYPAYPAAYVLTRDGEVCYEADDGVVISNTPGDETDRKKWEKVYFDIFPREPSIESQLSALTIWEGAMPESNGKSNFTVIMHNGDITEGICLYRSEYPDRARYEADCFRHLIGDPSVPEKPFIRDYDADKHSGYVKPDASPLPPVALVLPTPLSTEDGPHYSENQASELGYLAGYNACLDKVKELNK